MTPPLESDLVLNLVWTGRSFRLMGVFTESLLAHTSARLRFVANACPPDEIALLEAFAAEHPDRVVEVLDVSPEVMVGHGQALDEVIALRDDGDHVAFLDPDILATGPFLDLFLALVTEHDAVTSGTELWCDDNVEPEEHLGIGLGGRYFYSPDGFVYGCPHLGIYRRAPLLATMERWGVGFGSAGPDLRDDAREQIDRMGLGHKVFDTGKVLNILLQADGGSLAHAEHPALLHIGGLSHFVAPREVVLGPDGEPEPHWVRNAGVADRAAVARYTAQVLEARIEGSPLPEPPADAEDRLRPRMERARRALASDAGDAPPPVGLLDPTPEQEDFEVRFDAYVAEHDLFSIHHTVQITSFGGTGTTALCDHLMGLGVDIQPGPAHWPFKHARDAPTADEVPEGFRVVYLVGDPRNAVVSLFRRSYQVGHALGMHLDWRDARRRHRAGLPGRDPGTPRMPPARAARLTSLPTYLAAGVDDFDFAGHLDGWRDHPAGYPVLFVRYEHLGDRWSEVCDFVGLDASHPPLEIRPRASDWTALPRHQRGQLQRLYGDLAARVEALPPTERR